MGHSPTSRLFCWLMYCRTSKSTEDYLDAIRWYKLAGKLGNVDAQFNLGLMYEKGLGVAEDHQEAIKWYILSAEYGNPVAQILNFYMPQIMYPHLTIK